MSGSRSSPAKGMVTVAGWRTVAWSTRGLLLVGTDSFWANDSLSLMTPLVVCLPARIGDSAPPTGLTFGSPQRRKAAPGSRGSGRREG